jgi:hypothetical protein
MWGNRGIAPRILNQDTRWRGIGSFTLRLLKIQRKSVVLWKWDLGSKIVLDVLERNPLHLQGIEPRFIDRSACKPTLECVVFLIYLYNEIDFVLSGYLFYCVKLCVLCFDDCLHSKFQLFLPVISEVSSRLSRCIQRVVWRIIYCQDV